MEFRPQPGPQEAFLSSPADICIYGGAAGGGKSYALLLEVLRHINNPDFGAVIFRRNSTQVMSEGGLWDTASSIYPFLNAKSKEFPRPVWTFPSGAKVSFAHLQHENDKYSWQGAQIPLICFDELTHFSQSQFLYMLSRNRTTCGVKPYIRATTNPDASSWVAKFIEWWINQDTGYPIPERSGVIRYMARLNDHILWFDSMEEFRKTKKENPDFDGIDELKSVTFISSKLSDNKILMESDPSYKANLLAMSLVDKERLLNGNWKIMPSAGLYFPREKAKIIDTLPSDLVTVVRAWDFAATKEKEEARSEGVSAKTAGVLLAKTAGGRFVVIDVINKALSAEEVRNTVLTTARLDGQKPYFVTTRISQDPGQAGKDQAEQYIKLLSGFNVVAVRESGDKETRATPFSAQWQAGNVDLLSAPWNEEFIEQLDQFPEGKYKDMVDAVSNAFAEIEKGNVASVPETVDYLTHNSYWGSF